MLKPPITISIVPSRLAVCGATCLTAATSLVVACYAPLWLAAMAVIIFAGVIHCEWRRERPWTLRWVPGVDGGWQQRLVPGNEWHSVSVRCDYLGPWLIGLKVAGRRHWLWPDSATGEQRRALRRVLLWAKAQ